MNVAKVDLTEQSLLAMIEDIRASSNGPIRLSPTRFILPPWVVEEIEAQYGVPATQAKYHQWNMARCGLAEREYWAIIAPELVQ